MAKTKQFERRLDIGDVIRFKHWIIQWAETTNVRTLIQIRAPLKSLGEKRGKQLPSQALEFARKIGFVPDFGPGITRGDEIQLQKDWVQKTAEQNENARILGKHFLIVAYNETETTKFGRNQLFTPPTGQHIFYEAIECDKEGNLLDGPPLRVVFEMPRHKTSINAEQHAGIMRIRSTTLGTSYR